MPQVVVAHAAADDGDPLIAQGRQRLAELDVEGGIEILAQRQHDDRDFGLRIDDQEGHEHAVIEAALAVGRDGQARRLDEPLHFSRQLRIARRGIAELIGVLGKAVIVVEHAGLRVDADGRLIRLPMRGDDQERLRPLGQRFENAGEIVAQPVPGVRAEGRRKLDPEAGPPPCGTKITGWRTAGMGTSASFGPMDLSHAAKQAQRRPASRPINPRRVAAALGVMRMDVGGVRIGEQALDRGLEIAPASQIGVDHVARSVEGAKRDRADP